MDVSGFKGYRYDSSVVGDAGRCVAPPYDVIDPEHQQRLHEQSECNIVRIIKALPRAADQGADGVYDQAKDALGRFLQTGAIKQDAQESVYVYAQEFCLGERTYRRSGFVALGRLEGYSGAVRPHEHTLAGPKADRLKLMRATQCQVGQIFMLYTEQEGVIDGILARACQGDQLLSFEDEDKVIHRLFAVTDPSEIATLRDVMAHRDVFIADGHHRYETANTYYEETQNPAAQWRMMTFVNTRNEGLVVLPTHRLVKNVDDFSAVGLIDGMRGHYDVAKWAFDDMVAKQEKRVMMQEALALEFESGTHALGIYVGDGAFYVATLRDTEAMSALAGDHSEAWQRLDVSILHKLVLEQMLGIDDAALTEQSHVEYIKDIGDATSHAIDKVDSGDGQALFFLNQTRVEDVAVVAANGEKMPQKSTFFHPKIFSGLVMNRLQ